MAVKFNPFTGQLQIDERGASASYIDGEVATYNDLPLDGTAALNSAWLVREASGIWPVSRKQAGIYIRTATAGSSRDADYTYAGTMPDVFSDAVLTIYDEASTTRTGQFNLGSVTAGQNRVLTWPDGNGTIALTTTVVDNATGLWDSANSVTGATVADYELSITDGTNVSSLTFPVGASRNYTLPNASGTLALTSDFAAPPAIGSTTRNTIAATTLNANNGTITASAPVLDLSQTWNNAAVTFTGIQFNITNTASVSAASGSKYFEIAVGGVPQIRFQRNFSIPYLYFGNTDTGVGAGSTTLNIICNGGVAAQIGSGSSGISVRSDAPYQWSSTTGFAAADLQLFRDAADTLAQRRTTNPQTFRLYNTFTDASNYERAKIAWSSNVLQIGTEAGGTGSARDIEFQHGGTTRFSLIGNTIRFATTNVALHWQNATMLRCFSNGNLTLTTSNQLDFGLLQFGGTTSSFPALKRSSTALQVRLADDSADAPLSAASITLGAGTATAPSFALSGSSVGIYQRAAGELTLTDGSEPQARYFSNFIILNSDFAFAWGSSTSAPTGADTILRRDTAGTLAQYNGVNAQAYRLYNTFTSSTNFERLNVRWASNECIIDAEAGSGGGTLRGIKIGSATSSLLGFYGVTPVDQPATVADPAGGGTVDTEARTAINAIIDRLQELGLIA